MRNQVRKVTCPEKVEIPPMKKVKPVTRMMFQNQRKGGKNKMS